MQFIRPRMPAKQSKRMVGIRWRLICRLRQVPLTILEMGITKNERGRQRLVE